MSDPKDRRVTIRFTEQDMEDIEAVRRHYREALHVDISVSDAVRACLTRRAQELASGGNKVTLVNPDDGSVTDTVPLRRRTRKGGDDDGK